MIAALASAARLDPECLEMDGDKARITVQRRCLSDVAGLDQVKSINQVHPVKLHNNVARKQATHFQRKSYWAVSCAAAAKSQVSQPRWREAT